MATDPALPRALGAALRQVVPGLVPDRWQPSEQGAVGHVTGLRGPDGAGYVLKVYPAALADRLPAELATLRRLHSVPGERFGELRAPRYATAAARVEADAAHLLAQYTAAGGPALTGVVDLERADWGDPLADLAQTRVHVRFRAPHDVAALSDAYGVTGADEQRRVAVYELLHRVRERSWIVQDRPAGWQRSVQLLDDALAAAC